MFRTRTCCCSSTTSSVSTQAGSEVSTLLGRMPSAVGYQPNLADEMGLLQERITSTRGHSITSMPWQFNCLRMTTPTRRRQPPSRTWMRPPSSLVKSHRAVCTSN